MRVERILAIFLALGLIVSSFILFDRMKVENGYKTYEITLDYNEMLRYSSEAEQDMEKSLRDFKEAGVASVNIGEATINSLKMNEDFKIRTSFEGYDLVIAGENEGLKFIEAGLKQVLKESRKMTYRDDNTLVIEGKPKDMAFDSTVVRDFVGNKIGASTIGQASKLEYTGLGFLEDEIKLAKASGLNVLLRPVYIADTQDAKKSIDRFIDSIDKNNLKQTYVIFAGEQVIGSDEELDYLAKTLYDRNISVGMIEASVQREHLETIGLEPLVEKMDYKAIRAFTTWQFIQKRFDYGIPMHHNGEEIVNTFYRAITERNIRIIYFKPFIMPNSKAVTDMKIYKDRLDDLQERLLKTHDIKPGEVQPMQPLRARRSMQMIAAIGTLAAAFIMLENIIKLKRKHLLLGFMVSAILTGGIYAANIKLDLVNKLFGLLATIVFPSLAIICVLAIIKDILAKDQKVKTFQAYARGLIVLVLAIAISLIGAIYEVAFFAQSKYLLELDIFKGVKLSQVAPLAIALVAYMAYFGYGRKDKDNYLRVNEIKEFLLGNIKIWQALIVGVLLGAVALLLLRSGHESNVEPSSIELLVRNMLELFLPARPRNKAFLLGYPALILFVFLAFRKRFIWSFPAFALVAAIGQSNILNTFSHIRTPIYISYLRVSYELAIAVITGAIFVLCADLFMKFLDKVKKNA